MTFRPLHDRVLVEPLEQEEKTAGGIIIPDTAKEKPMEGKVVSVGSGVRGDDGKLNPLDVKKGRPRPLRQVVRDGSQDRRQRPSDHEGIRHPRHYPVRGFSWQSKT